MKLFYRNNNQLILYVSDLFVNAITRTLPLFMVLNAKLYIWLDPLSELHTNYIFNQIHMSLFTNDIFQLNVWRRYIRFSLEDIEKRMVNKTRSYTSC
jgi:hypothetical protein